MKLIWDSLIIVKGNNIKLEAHVHNRQISIKVDVIGISHGFVSSMLEFFIFRFFSFELIDSKEQSYLARVDQKVPRFQWRKFQMCLR